MPVYRLLIFIATCLANENKSEEDEVVTMKQVAEYAGIPADEFEFDDSKKYASPEQAASMLRG